MPVFGRREGDRAGDENAIKTGVLTAEKRTMAQSGEGLDDRVKAMAMETFWVLEVILCWVVALPILLIVFFGLILCEKIERMRLAQSRHPSGTDPPPLRSSRHTETRPSSSNLRQIHSDLRHDYIRHRPAPRKNI